MPRVVPSQVGQKQAKAAALLEYTKMRERRVLLENETERLAEAFEELAKKPPGNTGV